MSLSLRLIQTAECPVCKALKISNAEQIQSISQAIMLLAIGRSAYAICICCRRAVPKPWSRAYKARWRRYEKRLRKRREIASQNQSQAGEQDSN